MSQEENVEFVRRGFGDFVRTGEFDPDDFDPEFEFDNSNAMLDAAIYRGTEGVREFLSLMREMWKQLRFEPQEYIPVGEDKVVVTIRMIVCRDGIETVARSAGLFTLREAKLAHVKAFQSKADALEAAGLSE
jgi:ketosteroid isomerase-like protein